MAASVSELFSTIDAIITHDGPGVPAGAENEIQRVIRSLRAQRAASLPFAEELALEVHQLVHACRQRSDQGRMRSRLIRANLSRKWWMGMESVSLSSAA